MRGTKLILRETEEVLRESHGKSRGTPLSLRERVINIKIRTVKA